MKCKSFLTILFSTPIIVYQIWKIRKQYQLLLSPIELDYLNADGKGNPKILLIGDSRISRWQPMPILKKYVIINRGLGGETIKKLNKRVDKELLFFNPKVILIQAGINDLVSLFFIKGDRQSKKKKEIICYFKSIVDIAKKHQIKCVFYVNYFTV